MQVSTIRRDTRAWKAQVWTSFFCANDHPDEKRFAEAIETVTVDSVFRWLDRSGLGGRVQVIR